MSASAEAAQPKVLIVGAGPVGLALAIELGHRGVPCLVVERNDRVGYAPRAKTTNVRTREHLRRWVRIPIASDTMPSHAPIAPPCGPPNAKYAARRRANRSGHAIAWKTKTSTSITTQSGTSSGSASPNTCPLVTSETIVHAQNQKNSTPAMLRIGTMRPLSMRVP